MSTTTHPTEQQHTRTVYADRARVAVRRMQAAKLAGDQAAANRFARIVNLNVDRHLAIIRGRLS